MAKVASADFSHLKIQLQQLEEMRDAMLTPAQKQIFQRRIDDLAMDALLYGIAPKPTISNEVEVRSVSDKFWRVHERRLAKAKKQNLSIGAVWNIALIEGESLPLTDNSSFFAIHYVARFEVVQTVLKFVLTPATENDLTVIDEWEERNAAFFNI